MLPVLLLLLLQGCWQLAGGHGREVFDGLEVRLLNSTQQTA
jgi:hypothetical protein